MVRSKMNDSPKLFRPRASCATGIFSYAARLLQVVGHDSARILVCNYLWSRTRSVHVSPEAEIRECRGVFLIEYRSCALRKTTEHHVVSLSCSQRFERPVETWTYGAILSDLPDIQFGKRDRRIAALSLRTTCNDFALPFFYLVTHVTETTPGIVESNTCLVRGSHCKVYLKFRSFG